MLVYSPLKMTTIIFDIEGSKDLDVLDFSTIGEYKTLTLPEEYRGITDIEETGKKIDEFLADNLSEDVRKTVSFVVHLIKNKGNKELYFTAKKCCEKIMPDVVSTTLIEKTKYSDLPLYTEGIYYYRQEKEFESILKETLYTNKPITSEVVSELITMAKTENTLSIQKAIEAIRSKKPVIANFYNVWGLLWNINK